VLTDLPGVQRPRDALTERMQRRVESELADSDAALMLVNGDQGVGGPGDRFIAEALGRAQGAGRRGGQQGRPARPHAHRRRAAGRRRPDAGRRGVPDLRADGHGRRAAGRAPGRALPRGPFYFPPTRPSDQAETVLLAELVREQVLRRTRQEVPHSVEVQVDEIVEDPGDELITVRALLWVETESQKGILIGKHGAMIKAIGTASRKELERELGTRVHLELSVRVRRSWRADDALLDRLGIT
jgi:GTP-binding protein Era